MSGNYSSCVFSSISSDLRDSFAEYTATVFCFQGERGVRRGPWNIMRRRTFLRQVKMNGKAVKRAIRKVVKTADMEKVVVEYGTATVTVMRFLIHSASRERHVLLENNNVLLLPPGYEDFLGPLQKLTECRRVKFQGKENYRKFKRLLDMLNIYE